MLLIVYHPNSTLINLQNLDLEKRFDDKNKKIIIRIEFLYICFVNFIIFEINLKIELIDLRFTLTFLLFVSDIIYLIILSYFNLLDK